MESRGKHDYLYHSLTEDSLRFMEHHINSYQPGISHYRRPHAPHVLYVDPSLTTTSMYDSYVKACKAAGKSVKSYSSYYQTLKNEHFLRKNRP